MQLFIRTLDHHLVNGSVKNLMCSIFGDFSEPESTLVRSALHGPIFSCGGLSEGSDSLDYEKLCPFSTLSVL